MEKRKVWWSGTNNINCISCPLFASFSKCWWPVCLGGVLLVCQSTKRQAVWSLWTLFDNSVEKSETRTGWYGLILCRNLKLSLTEKYHIWLKVLYIVKPTFSYVNFLMQYSCVNFMVFYKLLTEMRNAHCWLVCYL